MSGADSRERNLVERAQGLDEQAFGELYDIYVSRVFAYVVRRVGNRSDAEDLTEKVFLKALEAIERFQWTGAPFASWLFRIAGNVVIDHFRKKGRTERAMEALRVRADDGHHEDVVHSVVRGEEAEAVRAALQELTEEQRQVVYLKFFGQLSTAEVAGVMGKSPGSVKALQHRALASLAKVLGRGGNGKE